MNRVAVTTECIVPVTRGHKHRLLPRMGAVLRIFQISMLSVFLLQIKKGAGGSEAPML